PHKASKVSDHVTVSMGLCHQQDQNTFTMDKLIQQADTSLYKSKEAGRNRTTLWSPT
ncbi:MAG: diguanylate cyclase, partial [Spirochaetaceae bacterium]|nr:diguanylate cyclase [Spirochaetaceae bacterium]